MSYIFLSYAKADRDTAFTMREVLQNEGFVVWMDENSHELHNRHWETIQENIRNAGAFVLLVSDAAKKSNWVARELDFAESLDKSIFPILIQGEGWSRLGMEMATLGLGLNLDMPDEFSLRMKHANQNAPFVPLPPLIYLSPDEKKKTANSKQPVLLLAGVMVVILAIFMLLYPAFLNLLEGRLRDNEVVADSSEVYSPIDYDATASAIVMELSETAEANGQSRSTESPRATATPRNSVNLQGEQVGRLLNFATQAAEVEIAERNAEATANYQSEMNMTAVAGGGVLPCEARGIEMNGVVQLDFYNAPAESASAWQLSRSANEAQPLTVIQWTVNDEGSWYRVLVQGFGSVPYYLRAESLVLDDNCPR